MKAAVAGAFLSICVGAVPLLLGPHKETLCLGYDRETTIKNFHGGGLL